MTGSARQQRRAGNTPPDPFQAAHAAALAALPGIGPASLAAIVGERTPVEAWAEVRAGRIERPPPRAARSRREAGPPDAGQAALFGEADGGRLSPPPSRQSWADFARRLDPVQWWKRYDAAGVGVTWLGHPDFPARLTVDPEPPGVLFWRGRLASLDALCVAVVGTRNATPDGRAIAFDIGRDLAQAGVCVVSGLALGIDGAAHAGALAAVRTGARGATVGVAASGVDVPYPRRHRSLWQEVTLTGAIISENLPGRPAQAWRFPSRNRVIAGLARMVVVVESHMCGGSLITAEAAIERGVEVRVVPGPVHSPASAGSNQLLYDGPGPVRNARDILDALGLFRPERPGRGRAPAPDRAPAPSRPRDPDGSREPVPAPRTLGSQAPATPLRASAPSPPASHTAVLQALGWRPVSTGQVMERTGLDAATTQAALDRLVASGLARAERGWWVRTG